jgi:hypothetical protein
MIFVQAGTCSAGDELLSPMHVRRSVVVNCPGFGFTGFGAANAGDAASAIATDSATKREATMI